MAIKTTRIKHNAWSGIPPILAICILIFLSNCSHPKVQQSFDVQYKGALKNIMRKGDLSAKVNLSEFKDLEHIYALGAFENLKGEIQIWDSKPFHTYVDGNQLAFDNSYSKNATLFVYAVVEDWISMSIPDAISSEKELESYIEKAASENNIDTNQPFPFRVDGILGEAHWHVINWKTGDQEHSHDKHISSGLNGILKNVDAELLGFYSNAHHAIFTHHTTNMHIHLKTQDGKIAGHLDHFVLGNNMTLFLPRNPKPMEE